MPQTIFTSFPLNLSLLLQNENNSYRPVAEGKTLPQKVLEDWIAQNGTDLDREADSHYRKFEAILALPQSERTEPYEEIRKALVELKDRGSALAARHLAALDMGPFTHIPQFAEDLAKTAIERGCEPAWLECLKAHILLLFEEGDESFRETCEQVIKRDECVLYLAEHLHCDFMDTSDVLEEVRDSLLRQAREGSVDALRFLFLALCMDRLPATDVMKEDVYALLCERAKTDIFCARLLAQYKLGLVHTLKRGMFGDEDEDEHEDEHKNKPKDEHKDEHRDKDKAGEVLLGNGDATGESSEKNNDRKDDDLEESDLDTYEQHVKAIFDAFDAPLPGLFEHTLQSPEHWAKYRTFLVHAAELGDSWSELVLHVYDALWKDCPHDAMAKLRELAHTKNYPPARTFLGALSFNTFARRNEGTRVDVPGDAPDLSTEQGRCKLAEYLKEAALAMPENPRLERIWLDFELLASVDYAREHPGEEPEMEWGGLTKQELNELDFNKFDDPLVQKADPQMRFAYYDASDPNSPPVLEFPIDFLADLPTVNPHLVAIRDRAVANSPYAAFLLGRALVNGNFGEALMGNRGILLLEACLDFAMLNDVEEAAAFYWALATGTQQILSALTLVDPLFQYRAQRYPSLCRLLCHMQQYGLQKWYLDTPHRSWNLMETITDLHMQHELVTLVMNSCLLLEPMGMFLAGLKLFHALCRIQSPAHVLRQALERDGILPSATEGHDVPTSLPDPYKALFSCIERSIRMALLVYDLPTLLFIYAALHHAVYENRGTFEIRDLQVLFSPLDGDNRDFEKHLRLYLKPLKDHLRSRGLKMSSLRKHFEYLDTDTEDTSSEDTSKRKARKQQRKRVKKGRKK